MQYTIVIQSSPNQNGSALAALKFSQALLASSHSIFRVFLYGEGVLVSNSQSVPPQDELKLSESWAEFIRENKIDAVVCIAAALKRGILNQTESDRYDKSSPAMDDSYDLSGLGQLIEASALSDKVITFS